MENIEYILVGIIAVFIILQLIRVLGNRTDADEEQIIKKDAMFQELEANRKARKLGQEVENLRNNESQEVEIDTNSKEYLTETYGEELATSIRMMMKHQKTFAINQFIDNSKIAFTMVQDAFSKGNKILLKELLTEKMFNMYSKSIDNLIEKHINTHVEIIGIKSAILKMINIDDDMATIIMQFDSEQINYISDDDNVITSGHDNKIITVKETWNFEKNINEPSNKWYLAKTVNIKE